MPRIVGAPRTSLGYFEARPGDVAGVSGLALVDVRAESELLGPSGHIHGIRHVPMNVVLSSGIPDAETNTAVVLVCEAGTRAQSCAKSLVERGYTEVYILVGGMRRWIAEEHPVARTRTWI